MCPAGKWGPGQFLRPRTGVRVDRENARRGLGPEPGAWLRDACLDRSQRGRPTRQALLCQACVTSSECPQSVLQSYPSSLRSVPHIEHPRHPQPSAVPRLGPCPRPLLPTSHSGEDVGQFSATWASGTCLPGERTASGQRSRPHSAEGPVCQAPLGASPRTRPSRPPPFPAHRFPLR